MGKMGRNEIRKVTTSYLNGIAVALLVSDAIFPAIMGWAGAPPNEALMVAAIVVLSLVLHCLARSIVKRHHNMTPPTTEVSMDYRTDRRPDPMTINSWRHRLRAHSVDPYGRAGRPEFETDCADHRRAQSSCPLHGIQPDQLPPQAGFGTDRDDDRTVKLRHHPVWDTSRFRSRTQADRRHLRGRLAANGDAANGNGQYGRRQLLCRPF
jgi:hypothetical protein